MNPRFCALETSSKRNKAISANPALTETSSETFGKHVFNISVMQRILPKEVFKNILNAMEGREKIKPEYADVIATGMKEWAISLGATHYTHIFQPLTGATAEKHDAFIDWNSPDQVIEKFNGKQLIQGEPDASSFPSGGLRSTYEARGYTGWDPSSPVFIWSGGDGKTMCIPSVFFSWTGDVLDSKIPLLRSDRKINDAVLRLLRLTGIAADYVVSTLGCEQEYFVIDRVWKNLRPDLVLAGRTVFGASPPKGQELQDHYFASVKDRILCYMREFELEALKLGIPVKTRHNEVAPAQHEVAPVFERVSTAIDHNIILMELMRQIAVKHELSCLLHEKPFHDLNGSGKHCNWSLSTDKGINLLDPTDTPENNLHFLVLLTAILNGVHKHSALLRASIGSAANDFRLGGHEAPPAIISIYMGESLEKVLDNIEKLGAHTSSGGRISYNLGLSASADFTKDNTDRNRTSPFAFTGNKFEFRAVGSSASPAFPITVLNAIVAESLNAIMDEIEGHLGSNSNPSAKVLVEAVVPVLRKYLKHSRPIRFDGDNYSEEWKKEAKKRGLPIIEKAVDAFTALKENSTVKVFEGILTKEELISRYEIFTETYCHTVHIETKLMIEIFQTQILPAAIEFQKNLAANITLCESMGVKSLKGQNALFKNLSSLIEKGITEAEKLEKVREAAAEIKEVQKRAHAFCYKVIPQGEALREIVDTLEKLVEDKLWPLPKYRELLFMI